MDENKPSQKQWLYCKEEYWPAFKRRVEFVGVRFKNHKDFERACADVYNHGLYTRLIGAWNALLVEKEDADKIISLGYRIEEFDPNRPYVMGEEESKELEAFLGKWDKLMGII